MRCFVSSLSCHIILISTLIPSVCFFIQFLYRILFVVCFYFVWLPYRDLGQRSLILIQNTEWNHPTGTGCFMFCFFFACLFIFYRNRIHASPCKIYFFYFLLAGIAIKVQASTFIFLSGIFRRTRNFIVTQIVLQSYLSHTEYTIIIIIIIFIIIIIIISLQP